ncbi:MAG: sensor histidine kinase [Planctomycetota bacterium]
MRTLHFPRRIGTQLLLILLVAVTIPLAALGALLLREGTAATEATLLRDYRALAEKTAETIEKELATGEEHLQILAGLLSLEAIVPGRVTETRLAETALRQSRFRRIILVDPAGREMAVSHPAPPRAWSGDATFQKSLSGNGGVTLSRNAAGLPLLLTGIPVRRLGRTEGVLLGEADARPLWKAVDRLILGREGRAFLMTRDGRLVSGDNKASILAGNRTGPAFPSPEATGRSGTALLRDGNREWLCAWAPVAPLDLVCILRQPAREALAFQDILKRRAIMILAVVAILAAALSILFARLYSQPLRTLTEGMEAVAGGNESARLPANRADEIGAAFRTFNTMTERLAAARQSERMALLGRTAGWISHDLRNRLTAIKAQTELLLLRGDDPAVRASFETHMPREIARAEEMIAELGHLARLDEIQPEWIAPADLAEEVAGPLRQIPGNRAITVESAGPLPPLRADRRKLGGALRNLLMNAIEATPDGGRIIVRIAATRLHPGRTGIQIDVEDNGPGIPPETARRLFDLFYTTKTRGTGLGLALSREIIRRHGGDITFSPAPGAGARFTVTIPAEPGIHEKGGRP